MESTNSYLADELTSAELRAQYDAHAKRLLKDKGVLANILTEVVPEFSGYTIEQARAAIEGEPKVASVPVRPSEAVRGENSESRLPGEGTITFDIVFTAVTASGEKTRIYVNVEAQKSFYPGYDLVTRGIIYAARHISQQMDIEYTPSDYDGVKKIYSIWVCMNTPYESREIGDVADTVFQYSMQPEILYCPEGREIHPERRRYDLMTVVFVCLGKAKRAVSPKEEEKCNRIIGLLSTLFSDTISVEVKKGILENRYSLPMTREMEKEAAEMCNISEALYPELEAQLAAKDAELAAKDAELAKMQAAHDAELARMQAALNEALAKLHR